MVKPESNTNLNYINIKVSLYLNLGDAAMAQKGGIGKNWIDGLYNVKLDFQHDRRNFRDHWGHRTEICSILVSILIIWHFRLFPIQISGRKNGLAWPGNQSENVSRNIVKIVKKAPKMLKILVLCPQWALKLLLSCWKSNFTLYRSLTQFGPMQPFFGVSEGA